MQPEEILDRTETCKILGISRQTLISWIRKGKLKVWKRVGTGSNSALLFCRDDIEAICSQKVAIASTNGTSTTGEPTAT